MRVISWACRAGGMVVSVHYEARVTPFLKGGMEWGSAPMLPSEAGEGKPPVERFARVGEVQLRPTDSVTARRARRQRWSLRRPGSTSTERSRESSRTLRMVVRQTAPDFVSLPARVPRPRLGAATVGRLA